MKVLVVAATQMEVEPLTGYLKGKWVAGVDGRFNHDQVSVALICAGAGLHRTCFALGNYLALHRTNLCIQVGIAGAYHANWALGKVVQVIAEAIADFGAENESGILTLAEMGLTEDIDSRTGLTNPDAGQFAFLDPARGLTVNLVAGSSHTAEQRAKLYDADIESMEGAGLFYTCLKMGVPFVEVRGISNFAGNREKAYWDIGLAVQNSNDAVRVMLETLSH